MGAYRIRQTSQGERQPECTHCGSMAIHKHGVRDNRQYYRCKACLRSSFGLPPDRRPKCPRCQATPHATYLPDRRFRYECPRCKQTWMSEYKIGRKEKSKERFQHLHTFYLNRAARNGLFEYVQATKSTDAQALRAIFRHVLTEKVLWTMRGTSPRSRLLTRIPRDPGAAATRFPDARPESLRKMKTTGDGNSLNKFRPTVLIVAQITVKLDNAAKEGLVHAMRHLNMNHADAARWLLANPQIPPTTPLQHPTTTYRMPPPPGHHASKQKTP